MNSVPPQPAAGSAVPWWGVASAVAAPVVLCAGWTIAARLQPGSYDAVRQTVSVLAAHGSTYRWVMTLAFIAVGGCDVVTGLALRSAALPGRIIIVAGGVGGMLVGLNPETIGAGGSPPHVLFASIGFVALTIWPVAAARAGTQAWALRPATSAAASALTAALLGWFAVELIAGGGQLGLAERALGELQALWPLAVVASCLIAARGLRRDTDASQIPASCTSSEPQ